ncbi:MAG: aminotransferase [Pseudomonadota bacterium]
MSLPLNANLAGALAPPVMEARRWVAAAEFPPDRPLLNLSQAAPSLPPPEPMRRALAEAILELPEAHFYGPVLGDTDLREAIAARWSTLYEATVEPFDVAVTSGCNQAFCAAITTLCAPGDAVVMTAPWYFNHKMWLDMAGVETVPFACDDAMLPDLEAARDALTPRTRAILLISPNNPTGVDYPPALIQAFYDLARERGIVLILDETYRDFRRDPARPHGLFAEPDWRAHFIHLYSFSKVYRLTGHRVGAMVTSASRLGEAEKFLDTVTICPSRVGQIGALYGIMHLEDWVAREREEVLARRAVLEDEFASHLPDWRVKSAGAYFAWVEPPFDIPAHKLARRLVEEQSMLILPGTMFTPKRRAGDRGPDPWGGEAALRIAFANADTAGLAEMSRRLAAFRP